MTEQQTILEPDFIEKLIIKSALTDKTFLILISNVFEPEYFTLASTSSAFKALRNHIEEFSNIAPRDVILNSTDNREDVEELFGEIDAIEFDVASNYEYLTTETNKYLKEQAVKRAILDSVNVIESRSDRNIIRQKIEEALCKDIKVDLGLDYFGQLRDRLIRIFTASDIRIPTFFPQFDEYLSGGFPPFTLSVLTARIHGFKSNIMANFIARQVLHGYNVGLMTLEMSEDAFAQRFDSIYSLMDINRMYITSEYRKLLIEKLQAIKGQDTRGNLYIKQFPTGRASIKDFRIYIRELLLRGIKLDIIYVDYINLMMSEFSNSDNMYSKVKAIAEELRAMSFEFEVPIISVSQLNREGSFVGFEELDYNYIAESMGLPATADFMAILGADEDSMVYQSELFYKIVKNRLGGRVGDINKFYYDSRSLKMYDDTELDLWISEAEQSGDVRERFEQQEVVRQPRGRRGQR